ncbi:hypothetical protein E2C01_032088 [Portunus trituberculatus]|uniref:Uncharacterized protein n=1 Tax=Portunus trituberculatus TaxID=210409 RepID=A0A5B7F000_PORTR|nr:hypothetical protein [Portunus trituberculatus]
MIVSSWSLKPPARQQGHFDVSSPAPSCKGFTKGSVVVLTVHCAVHTGVSPVRHSEGSAPVLQYKVPAPSSFPLRQRTYCPPSTRRNDQHQLVHCPSPFGTSRHTAPRSLGASAGSYPAPAASCPATSKPKGF